MQPMALCLAWAALVVVRLESEVKFVVAEVVGTVHLPHPGQFQQVIAFVAFQVDDDERAVPERKILLVSFISSASA